MRAGETALRQGAWSEARRQFNAALRSRQTPEALEGLGWAEWWLDRPPASFAARERAYALYRKRGDWRSAARVATALAIDHIDYRGEPAVGRGWIERSRRLLEGLERTPEYGWALLWQSRTFSAISRLSLASRARYTSPIPTDSRVMATPRDVLCSHAGNNRHRRLRRSRRLRQSRGVRFERFGFFEQDAL